jgi:hypothetical protein
MKWISRKLARHTARYLLGGEVGHMWIVLVAFGFILAAVIGPGTEGVESWGDGAALLGGIVLVVLGLVIGSARGWRP